MTAKEKSEILVKISAMLDEYVAEEKREDTPEPPEMLTVKECAETVKGLSEHTVRMLIARGELASFRTGAGKHGKILVPKSSLLDYIHKIQA